MNKETYIERRNELLEKGQKLINEGKISEFNDIKTQIEKLDNDYEEYTKTQANLNALQDNHKITDIWDKAANVNVGKVVASTGSKNTFSMFLNKGDKLSDRVQLDEDEQIFNRDGALGEIIRGTVTGNWKDKELKNAITTTTSGVLIPSVLSSRIIDLARDISLFTSAGVPVAPMETNNLKISRVKTDPVFKFKEEGKAATESSFELDDVELKAKTVYGYAYLTLEAIESSMNLENIVQQTFANAIAQAIDKAFLYGQNSDSFAPSGILNDENINSITATADSGYDDIIKAIGKVKQANGIPTVIGINSHTEELLALLKDQNGNYLAKPRVMEDLNTIVSNQLKYDSSAGSDALVFDPQALLIGIQKNLSMKIIEDTNCIEKGLIGIQLYSMQDCKTVYPKHICKITGIK